MQIKKHTQHKAFTMLELLFVIVIMGILAKFGVAFIAKAYESFIFSKINNDLQSKSASAVEFIAKRLEYRIKPSTISRNLTTGDVNYLNDTGLSDPDATVLEWISTDSDGFRGTTAPLWSGIIDLNSSNATRLISPATNLASLNNLVTTLSYKNNADINDTAIYFINSYITQNPWGYDGNITEVNGTLTVSHIAMDGITTPTNIIDQNQTLHPIQSASNSNELWPKFSNFSGTEVYEYYKLAWTANAVRLKDYNETTHIGDLYFYYDYRPWNGETFKDAKKVLLAKGINTFRFRSAGSLMKIQVCAKSELTDEEYALCKEKTVY